MMSIMCQYSIHILIYTKWIYVYNHSIAYDFYLFNHLM